MSVFEIARLTRAGSLSRKEILAWSRRPSPLGLIVASSGRSPANAFPAAWTWKPVTAGAVRSAKPARAGVR